ncbi:hypothetical protein MFIFM68171_02456 [Madurella fahalii]|uniref:Altered inheritance of mitochondria protein 11 n=1 Tax=Madurella fahalii TaxID=1157608 RepID=A0ABQ0G3A3_9PEZI
MLFSYLSSLFSSKPASENNNKLLSTTPAPAPASAPATNTPNEKGTLLRQRLAERPPYPPVTSARSLKQLGLYFGGAGFLAFSILITRRAVTRYKLASQLKFFEPTNGNGITHHGLPQKDPGMALQALNLATLNTFSFGIMMAGGISWAFDISTVDDLKRLTRRSMDAAGGDLDPAAEEEIAQWVANTFGITEKPSSDESSKS